MAVLLWDWESRSSTVVRSAVVLQLFECQVSVTPGTNSRTVPLSPGQPDCVSDLPELPQFGLVASLGSIDVPPLIVDRACCSTVG